MSTSPEGTAARWRRLYGHLHWIPRHLGHPANPLRYVHGRLRKALRPTEFLRRRAAGRRLTRDLDPVLERARADFEQEGMVHVDHLVDAELLRELSAYYEQTVVPRRERLRANAARPFFFPLRTDDDIAVDGITARFAMQEKILKLVCAYMGKFPFLRNLQYLESNPVQQTAWEQSQLWHLDYYYTMRTPALWVYLTEVDSIAQGPFTYLPAPASSRLSNNLVPRHLTDEEIAAAGLAGEVRHVMAPRLSCFLVDNSRIYHLGSRMGEGGRRAIYAAHYVDPVGEKPWVRMNQPPPEPLRLLFARE